MNLLRVGLIFSLLTITLSAAQWDPLSPADLAPNAAKLDPEAPAETLFRRIDVDDRNFPEVRVQTAYNRYRIFDPERATDLTRLSYQSVEFNGTNYSGETEIRVRLTQPDGVTKEFGNEALRERTVSREGGEKSWLQRVFANSGLQVTEKFLVVPGIQSGAILDVRVTTRSRNLQQSWIYTATLQQFDIPIRTLNFHYRSSKNALWQNAPFLLNWVSNQAKMESDPKAESITITAQNLAALYHEPFSVPLPNYALTFIADYHPVHSVVRTHHQGQQTSYRVDPNTDPWGNYATGIYMREVDRTVTVSEQLKLLANSLISQGDSESAEARAIHQYVQDLHRRYIIATHPTSWAAFDNVDSEAQLVAFEKFPNLAFVAQDFVFLEVALDQALGLQAQAILLPNLSQIRFNPKMIADSYLNQIAVRVHADGKWHFSDPVDENQFDFDVLPWELMGQVGLVVRPSKQEFFPVPASDASKTVLKITGEFELAADGKLTGHGVQTFTGQLSGIKRYATRKMTVLEAEDFFTSALREDLKGAEIKVTDVDGRQQPSAPIKVGFTLEWPNFAVATKSRLIFHPAIFHFQQPAPLTTEVRHSNFQFPFRWTAQDETIIRLPEGFEMESKQQPAPLSNEILSYRCDIAQEKGTKRVHFDRELVSNIVAAQLKANALLLQTYRTIVESDGLELVLHKTAEKSPGSDDTTP